MQLFKTYNIIPEKPEMSVTFKWNVNHV